MKNPKFVVEGDMGLERAMDIALGQAEEYIEENSIDFGYAGDNVSLKLENYEIILNGWRYREPCRIRQYTFVLTGPFETRRTAG